MKRIPAKVRHKLGKGGRYSGRAEDTGRDRERGGRGGENG